MKSWLLTRHRWKKNKRLVEDGLVARSIKQLPVSSDNPIIKKALFLEGFFNKDYLINVYS